VKFPIDKAAIRQAIIERLESELAVLIAAANASKDEATDQENRQEGKYDMRGQSAAYLATGQAKLAAELAEAIAAYRNLSLSENGPGTEAAAGSMVTLESQGQKSVYFIGPARGGIDLEIGGVPVTVITAFSPLGRQIVGQRAGNAIKLASHRPGQVFMISGVE
jgi:transcription elongation GreA/GreB family factor